MIDALRRGQPPNGQFTINRASPQARGLVGWWPLSAAVGAVVPDLSGYGNNGAMPGGASNPTRIGTPLGMALDFVNASSQYITVADSDIFTIGDNATTFAVWAYHDGTRADRPLFSKYQDTSPFDGEWQFAVLDFGYPALWLQLLDSGPVNRIRINTTSGIPAGWSLFVGRYDGSGSHTGLSLFVNGRPVATTAQTQNTYSGTTNRGADVLIGASLINDSFAGYYDYPIVDVRMYSRALSDNEIYSLYDPATRWDLYQPIAPPRYWLLPQAVAGGGGTNYELTATIAGASSTPDNVSATVGRELAAAPSGASATPDNAAATIDRALTSSIAGASTTPAATLAISRLFAAAINGASATPDDVTLTVAGLIQLSATVAGISSTPDTVALSVARALSAAVAGASVTPDTVTLAIAGIIELSASIAGASATPDDAQLSIARALTAAPAGASTTPDTVTPALARALTAAIAGSSTAPDDAALAVARALSASITGASTTPDTVRLLTGLIVGLASVAISSRRPGASVTSKRPSADIT